jgi:hypothetical protein
VERRDCGNDVLDVRGCGRGRMIDEFSFVFLLWSCFDCKRRMEY